jgi:mRNA interferase RelE/StbE
VQVNFSAQSMGELNQLPADRQLELIGELANLRREQFYGSADAQRFGRVQRENRTFYRVRIGDLRFYMELFADSIFCHHILPKHSFEDFCFRCGLAAPDDGQVEQNGNLWHFLGDGEGETDNGGDGSTPH